MIYFAIAIMLTLTVLCVVANILLADWICDKIEYKLNDFEVMCLLSFLEIVIFLVIAGISTI